MSPNNPTPPDNSLPDQTQRQKLIEMDQRLFECLSLGLVVFDPELKIIHYNPAAEFLIRDHKSIAEALNIGTLDSQYQDWNVELHNVIQKGYQQRFEQIVFRDDQHHELLLNLTCVALTDPTGSQITGGSLVIEDVTAAVSMETRLAVSEKMAAVGKLAARVAHELNNPLDGILRYLNLIDRAMAGGNTDKITQYLHQARDGLIRMTEIVRELVQFSRSAYTAFDDSSINSIVEEAVKVMSEKAVQNNVSIICTLNENVPAARGTNLFQVFCNLIKNAIDAMPDGGTLTITTQVVNNEVFIRFEDTGIGLPEQVDQIFEPFFTTKETGKGTGLGLAICKDIIEKYNGKIEPESRPSGGTTFNIIIPMESCATIRSTQKSPPQSQNKNRPPSATEDNHK
ncbi:MAG: GHKL domain-containing protein [Planctomycetota bacterium]|nr:MAG: GHKL domain-containing protein [Planctomycetota bacterium]